jgi:type IV pilus assembly protein PilM
MATNTPVGLDIGSMSIRALETSRHKDGSVITNFGQTPLPAGTVQGGMIQDEQAVTNALRYLWTNIRFRSREVVLGVTNPQVVIRQMSVTNLPARELRKALPFQVRDALPLPVERSLLDFYPLEDAGGNETIRGLLIAAPKDAVLTAVRAIEKAGLHVAKVDLASFALLRAASRLDRGVEAIADIGAQTTSVIVHTDGEPLIVRTLPRGGVEITEMVASRLNLTTAEAEEVKCRVGLVADEEPEAAAAVREAVRPLVNEIRSSFAYVKSGDRQAKVTRLALSGGSALLPGLMDMLKSQLNVEVALADPTTRLHNQRRPKPEGFDQFRSSAAVSIGLTLGAAR